MQRILDGDMDLGMIGDSVEESSSELEIVDFQGDEIILVASPSHPVHSLDTQVLSR
ncbi:MAG: hypothetical protein CM1200mP22_31810 [Dehalococcoidia bacterium]|nr:MAG: hypothetical protein CM1200mP22_31810 [Dehalococcoidia bacterium]